MTVKLSNAKGEITAQLSRDARTVLEKIRTEVAAGKNVPKEVTGTAGILEDRLSRKEWAVVRQLLEGPAIAPYLD